MKISFAFFEAADDDGHHESKKHVSSNFLVSLRICRCYADRIRNTNPDYCLSKPLYRCYFQHSLSLARASNGIFLDLWFSKKIDIAILVGQIKQIENS